jgi:hypothetical protein
MQGNQQGAWIAAALGAALSAGVSGSVAEAGVPGTGEYGERSYAFGRFLDEPSWYEDQALGLMGRWQCLGACMPEALHLPDARPGDLVLAASSVVPLALYYAMKFASPGEAGAGGFRLHAFRVASSGEARPILASAIANADLGRTMGIRVAGLLNAGMGEVRGLQLSLGANVAGDVTGAQIGLVNVGRHVRGLQLGLVNISRSIDGVPVGLVNVVRDGRRGLDLWASDTAPLNAGVHLGSRMFYTLLAAGVDPGRHGTRVLAGVGGGIHLDLTTGLSLDLDEVVWLASPATGGDAPDAARIHVKTRLVAGVRTADHVSLLAGITASLTLGVRQPDARGGEMVDDAMNGIAPRLAPGFVLGIRIG